MVRCAVRVPIPSGQIEIPETNSPYNPSLKFREGWTALPFSLEREGDTGDEFGTAGFAAAQNMRLV